MEAGFKLSFSWSRVPVVPLMPMPALGICLQLAGFALENTGREEIAESPGGKGISSSHRYSMDNRNRIGKAFPGVAMLVWERNKKQPDKQRAHDCSM